MDGLSRAIPVPGSITLAGRDFVVKPRIIEHQAEIEAEILRLKPDPFDLIEQAEEKFKSKPELMATVVTQLVQMATSVDTRCATPHDYTTFCQSFRGHAFCLWLAIRDDAPDETVDSIQQLVMKEVTDLAEKAAADGGLEAVENLNQAVVEVLTMMESVINKATGEDPLGNSTGSPPTPPTKSTENTGTASESESTGD